MTGRKVGRAGAGARWGRVALAVAVGLSGAAMPPVDDRPGVGEGDAPGLSAAGRGMAASTVLATRDGLAEPGPREATALWGWPLAGRPQIERGFDLPEHRWSAGHRGIDLRGVVGEAVLAVDAGVVAFGGSVAGVGVVSVDHASGLRSTYQPVDDSVAAGTRVARGDRLGRLGRPGHCTVVDCLHLGARRGRDYVDPTPLLLPLELTLLPLSTEHGG